MTAPQCVLVAVDPPASVPDLAPVVELVRGTGWRICLIHALTAERPSDTGSGSPIEDQLLGSRSSDALGEAGEAAMDALAAVADGLAGNGVEVDTHVLMGPPVDVVLTAAQMLNAAMIVVAGHRHQLDDRTLLGSFTSSLLKVAERPVLVIPAGAARTDPGFVAAVDRLIEIIDRDEQAPELTELREAATAQLKQPDSEQTSRHLGDRLRDALHRFETSHPTLTSAINDVSYYLSGMGI